MARSFSHPIQTVTNLPLALAFFRSSLARRCTAFCAGSGRPTIAASWSRTTSAVRALVSSPRSAASSLSVVTNFQRDSLRWEILMLARTGSWYSTAFGGFLVAPTRGETGFDVGATTLVSAAPFARPSLSARLSAAPVAARTRSATPPYRGTRDVAFAAFTRRHLRFSYLCMPVAR